MNGTTIDILFTVLCAQLKGETLSESEKALCTDESVSEMLQVVQRHDLTHMICTSLLENQILPKNNSIYQASLYKAIFRYEKQNYELGQMRDLLNQIGVPFIVLKGSVLREYYKDPWLRTSCDIDILIRKADMDRARDAIVGRLNYQPHGNSTHDISFLSPSGVCLELHFALIEPDFKASPVLTELWEGTDIVSVSKFEYGMTSELFLFYHVYHMAKHFIHGGCGIKPLIDLWIIKNKMGYDEEKAIELLLQNDLLEFYRGISDLADVWFGNKEHTPITKEMEEYILQGGVYGTLEQLLAMSQNKKGSKGKHLLSKIFLSYESMLIYYPSLKKCPLLYPLYQVRRWFRIAFCGGRKRAWNEMRLNQNLSELKREKAKRLIDELKL